MTGPLEIVANAVNAVSIVLAGRNSVHTWWTGICGCLLFAWLFTASRLYADVTLQAFFIGTSLVGWRNWARRENRPITRTRPGPLAGMAVVAVAVAAGYAWLLHRFTDAAAPLFDSLVLMLSVVAQLLLMNRRLETWWFWLAVDAVAVPLFASRGLFVTAALYAAFGVNAAVSLVHWRRLMNP